MRRPAGFWIACCGAFLLPLVYTWNTYDRYVLPKLLFIGLLVLSLSIATVFRWSLQGRVVVRRTPLDLPLVATVGAAAISTAFAINRNVALFGIYFRYEGLLTILLYALLFWLTAQQLSGSQEALRLLRCLLASGYLVGLVAIVQSVVSNLATVPGADTAFSYGGVLRAFSTFGNPNFLGVFFAMLLPLALYELLRSTTVLARLLFANLLVVMTLALLLTFSRSAWVAAALALLVLLLAHGGRGRLVAGLAGALLIVAIAGDFMISRQAQVSSGSSALSALVHRALSVTESGGSTRSRIGVWQEALRVSASRPLTGYGPDSFGIVYPRYRTGDWAPGYLIDKAHNDPLQLAATEGILGVAAYVWLSVAMAVAFWRGRAHPVVVAAAAGALAYFTLAQVNFSFSPAASPWWTFAAAALVLASDSLPKQELTLPLPLPRALAITSAAVVSVVIAVLVVPGLVKAFRADMALYSSIQANGLGDRQGGNTTTVRIDSPAILVGSCTVYVTITYTCFPPPGGYPAFGSISVSQVLPGNGGSGSFTPICDDQQQKQSIPVFGMFSPGDAAASVFICGFDCNGTSREIKIVLK